MPNRASELKREEILALAQESKLMIVDGNLAYMNDMATQKELIGFVRLVEARLLQRDGGLQAGSARMLGDVVDFPEFDERDHEHGRYQAGN